MNPETQYARQDVPGNITVYNKDRVRNSQPSTGMSIVQLKLNQDALMTQNDDLEPRVENLEKINKLLTE